MNIPTRAEFLKKKKEKEDHKVETQKERTLERAVDEISRGKTHLIGVPNNDEVINHVRKALSQAGWGVKVKRSTHKHVTKKNNVSKEYEVVTLYFGDLEDV